ncbi:MAG TPA: VWA domain-containing protein [Candidatus Binataceae bacterium]|nr:VWA domain-containing protein [Candidatus Binataceae bacterium]
MRISTLAPVLMAAAVVAWPHAAIIAQSAGDNAASSASARQVQIPVVVRDKRGAPVTDLTAGDLAITDNGRPQTIQTLAQSGKAPLQAGLLVDTDRGMARALDSQHKAAEKFVDLILSTDGAGTAPANQVFLIHFDREVELLQDFTSSRDKLHTDLEQLGPTRAPADTQGPETADSEGGYGNRRNASPQLYDAIYLAADDLMKSKQGRKALVVFSNGFDGGSKESLNEAIEAAERAHTPIYTIYFRGDEQRAAGGGFPGGRRGRVSGWPGTGGGWPGGAHPGGGGTGSQLPQVDGRKIMEQIAVRTGGLYFQAKKVSEFDDIYNQIARNALAQYLLTYTPDHSDNDAEFHKIAMKATRSDLTVTAPEGYYSAEDETK